MAEIALLVATSVVDTVLAVRTAQPGGLSTSVLNTLVPYSGSAAAVLAVLRRRFAARTDLLAASVVALSVLSTAVSVLTDRAQVHPTSTETVAAVLLVGAACRRLAPVMAAGIAVLAGIAVVAAPILRYGTDSPMALLAAPAGLMWGVALAIGLILRDADARQRAGLIRARTDDRLQVARDLHDLVAHHVSGIVVRVRAAQALAGNPAVPPQDPAEVYGEIEEAAAEALVAMRQLVGMLRSTDQPLPLPDANLGDVVRAAAGGSTGLDVAVAVADSVDELPAPSQVTAAVHRIVLEALTNVHRHAPHATDVRVSVRRDEGNVVLDIDNDGVLPDTPGGGTGYGIVGMTERAGALGGTLEAGPRPGSRWQVTARVPLGDEDEPFAHLPKGI
ncbi:sensor histidine kinase [Actinophytocola oryzae]|uniref:sensor histidine kinase n=1 Tax=Actinophytocola oryzae TaxID=502181 RepID=UPI001FBAE240|nr:histidine kinase [Actinophytocola oryzae]